MQENGKWVFLILPNGVVNIAISGKNCLIGTKNAADIGTNPFIISSKICALPFVTL